MRKMLSSSRDMKSKMEEDRPYEEVTGPLITWPHRRKASVTAGG